MAKYPLSCRNAKTVSLFFNDIMQLHFSENAKILDPCCGEKRIWKEVKSKYWLFYSDIRDDLPDTPAMDYKNINYVKESFDGILFDPPYLFGVKSKNDKREDGYGGYSQSKENLFKMMRESPGILIDFLKPDGKLILKCSDQYFALEKKFYHLSEMWHRNFISVTQKDLSLPLSHFYLVDKQIFIVHRVSPTAYQVKNRGCSIQNYTYFFIFQKQRLDK